MVPGPGWSRAGSRTRPGGSHEDPVLLCPAGGQPCPLPTCLRGQRTEPPYLGWPRSSDCSKRPDLQAVRGRPAFFTPTTWPAGWGPSLLRVYGSRTRKTQIAVQSSVPGGPWQADASLGQSTPTPSWRGLRRPSRDGRPGRGGCPRAQPLRPSRPRVTPLPHVTAPGQTLRPGPEAHSQNCAEDEPARPARPPQTRPLVSWVSLRSMPGWRGEQEVGHPNHSSGKPPRERLRVRGRFLRPEVPVYGGGRARPLPLTLTAGFA